jgi:uncharacterized protein
MRELTTTIHSEANGARQPADKRQRSGVVAMLLLGVIRAYQRFVSPALPVVTLGACACRFSPTCSEYAAQAVKTHGALRGAWLAMLRLAKCTPLHRGGFDPVPARPSLPVCRSVSTHPRTLSLS